MRTLIALALSFALIGSAVCATVTSTAGSATVTAATFNATPDCVLSVTNATGNDGTWFSASYQTALFGPGTSNSTIYLWGVGTSGTYSLNLIVRTISATIAAFGNDTLEAAVPTGTTDATSSATTALVPRYATPVYAVGPASFAAAMVLQNGATPNQDLLVLYTATPTGFGTPKTIATASTPTTAATITSTYSYAVNYVWYEDGVYYVLFENQYVTSSATGTVVVAGLYIQAVTVSTGTNLYSTGPMAVTTSYTNTGTTAGVPLSGAMAQNSYNTNSTSIYVIWNDMTTAGGALQVVKGAIVTRSTGAVSTAAMILATSVSGTSQTASGIITYNGTSTAYGFIVTQFVTTGTVATVNAYFNANTTATSLAITESSPTSGGTMGRGFNYGSGYGVILGYPTGTSPTTQTFVAQNYYANGTANGTQATIGTFQTGTYATKVSIFADANGALWFGYVNSDNAATKINSAYIGRLYGQINATTTTTTFGSALSTFAALLSFIIVSVFMF